MKKIKVPLGYTTDDSPEITGFTLSLSPKDEIQIKKIQKLIAKKDLGIISVHITAPDVEVNRDDEENGEKICGFELKIYSNCLYIICYGNYSDYVYESEAMYEDILENYEQKQV